MFILSFYPTQSYYYIFFLYCTLLSGTTGKYKHCILEERVNISKIRNAIKNYHACPSVSKVVIGASFWTHYTSKRTFNVRNKGKCNVTYSIYFIEFINHYMKFFDSFKDVIIVEADFFWNFRILRGLFTRLEKTHYSSTTFCHPSKLWNGAFKGN